MKKRVLGLLLVISMLASVFVTIPIVARAYTGSYNDGTLYYNISDGKVTITDCKESASGALTIPATLNDYPVTSIGGYAFYCCNYLTRVKCTIANAYLCHIINSLSPCNNLASEG